MGNRSPKRGTSIGEVLFLIAILGTLLMIALLALPRSVDTGRRDHCTDRMKQYGVALLMHVDARRELPPTTSTNVAFAPAGSATPMTTTATPHNTTMSGYSWIAKILPYLGETQAYDTISMRSNRFSSNVAPFGETMTQTGLPFSADQQAMNRHLSTLDFDILHCPSFSGLPYSAPLGGAGQPENYRSDAFAPTSGQTLNPPIGLFITNYVALSATHMNCMAQTPAMRPVSEPPNGAMIPGKGMKLAGIADGQTKTFLLCETREQGYNSWYDGSTVWTVGILASTGDYHWPSADLQVPDRSVNTTTNPTGLWRSSTNSSKPGKTALNFGSLASQSGSKNIFLADAGTDANQVAAASGVSAQNPWGYGPSSEHPGIVQHLLVDGSVKAISDKIDPTLYMRLITRAGKEPDAMPQDN